MKENLTIIYIVAGAGQYYSGATTRDAVLINQLKKNNHKVITIALYSDLKLDDINRIEDYKIFFKFDNKTIIQKVAEITKNIAKYINKVGRNKKKKYEIQEKLINPGTPLEYMKNLKIDILNEADKKQKIEFKRLINYIEKQEKVDAIILSNILLAGLGSELKKIIEKPVIGMSQGENSFIEEFKEPRKSTLKKIIRKNAKNLDLVVTNSNNGAMKMVDFLAIPAAKINTVYPAVDVEMYQNYLPRNKDPFTIGFLANISEQKGVDVLIDAVEIMVNEFKIRPKLKIAGKIADKRYWKRVEKRIKKKKIEDNIEVVGELGWKQKKDFFTELSVFATPTRNIEVRGTAILEAMAAKIPVVAPGIGIIPEIFYAANGGLQVNYEVSGWMFAQAFLLLHNMPETADALGMAAAKGIIKNFNSDINGKKFCEIIQKVVENNKNKQTE